MAQLRKTDYNKYYSIAGAIITWCSVAAQLYLSLKHTRVSLPEALIRFFSFFTILSNLLVALIFSMNALKDSNSIRIWLQKRRALTAIVTYITITGLVYHIFIAPVLHIAGAHLAVSHMLHTLVPVMVIVYWVIFQDKRLLKWTDIPAGLVFPLIYLAYTLIRGGITGFYPYIFLDAGKLGWAQVAINVVGLSLIFIFFLALYVGIAKLHTRKKLSADTY
jgi:hypothetical protein